MFAKSPSVGIVDYSTSLIGLAIKVRPNVDYILLTSMNANIDQNNDNGVMVSTALFNYFGNLNRVKVRR